MEEIKPQLLLYPVSIFNGKQKLTSEVVELKKYDTNFFKIFRLISEVILIQRSRTINFEINGGARHHINSQIESLQVLGKLEIDYRHNSRVSYKTLIKMVIDYSSILNNLMVRVEQVDKLRLSTNSVNNIYSALDQFQIAALFTVNRGDQFIVPINSIVNPMILEKLQQNLEKLLPNRYIKVVGRTMICGCTYQACLTFFSSEISLDIL